jgi:hypothetical protein
VRSRKLENRRRLSEFIAQAFSGLELTDGILKEEDAESDLGSWESGFGSWLRSGALSDTNSE